MSSSSKKWRDKVFRLWVSKSYSTTESLASRKDISKASLGDPGKETVWRDMTFPNNWYVAKHSSFMTGGTRSAKWNQGISKKGKLRGTNIMKVDTYSFGGQFCWEWNRGRDGTLLVCFLLPQRLSFLNDWKSGKWLHVLQQLLGESGDKWRTL